MNQSLITFLNQVILDIQNNNLTPQQILHLTSFYSSYISSQKLEELQSTDLSPSLYNLLTAGIIFYSSLSTNLNIPLNLDCEDDPVNELSADQLIQQINKN